MMDVVQQKHYPTLIRDKLIIFLSENCLYMFKLPNMCYFVKTHVYKWSPTL